MSDIRYVSTSAAPAPGGHYSQAAAWKDLAFISGQLPIDRDGSHDPARSFEDQARLALSNLLAIARAAGAGPDGILKVTAYIVGTDNWPAFNRIYAELFGTARPARAVVPVPGLHHGYLIEVEAVVRANESGEHAS